MEVKGSLHSSYRNVQRVAQKFLPREEWEKKILPLKFKKYKVLERTSQHLSSLYWTSDRARQPQLKSTKLQLKQVSVTLDLQ